MPLKQRSNIMTGESRARLGLFPLFIALLVVMASCHRNKTSIPDFDKLEGEAVSLDSAYALFSSTDTGWVDMYAPVTVSVFDPKENTISGRATIVNGKYIHLSFRAMGMEVAVVHIEQDTVYILDKYHKHYEQAAICDIFAVPGASVDDIQRLLLGLPIPQSALPEGCTAEARITANSIESVAITDDAYSVVAFFGNRIGTPAGLAAQDIALQAVANNEKTITIINWKLDEAQWDTGRTAKRPSAPTK